MSDSILENNIEKIISEPVSSLGYNIVRIKLIDGNRKTLQIMAERKNDCLLTLDDCTKISHLVSAILDVENPLIDEYNLEVSSPGIDRPLVKPEDFRRFAEKMAKISTKLPIEGRKRFKGVLNGTSEEGSKVLMKTNEGEEVLIPLDNIASAKLVLTDSLIEEARK